MGQFFSEFGFTGLKLLKQKVELYLVGLQLVQQFQCIGGKVGIAGSAV